MLYKPEVWTTLKSVYYGRRAHIKHVAWLQQPLQEAWEAQAGGNHKAVLETLPPGMLSSLHISSPCWEEVVKANVTAVMLSKGFASLVCSLCRSKGSVCILAPPSDQIRCVRGLLTNQPRVKRQNLPSTSFSVSLLPCKILHLSKIRALQLLRRCLCTKWVSSKFPHYVFQISIPSVPYSFCPLSCPRRFA